MSRLKNVRDLLNGGRLHAIVNNAAQSKNAHASRNLPQARSFTRAVSRTKYEIYAIPTERYARDAMSDFWDAFESPWRKLSTSVSDDLDWRKAADREIVRGDLWMELNIEQLER